MSDSFEYSVVVSVKALVFSEKDVRDAIKKSMSDARQSGDGTRDILKIEYGSVDADFKKNTIQLKVYSEVTNTPIINYGEIKQELLGKKDDQLSAILMKYPSIKNVSVEFWPKVVNRVPQYPQRVTVEVMNIAN